MMPRTSPDFSKIPSSKYGRIKELHKSGHWKKLDIIYKAYDAYPPGWPKCATCDKEAPIMAWTNYAIKKGYLDESN